jgi:hypothetical protein
VTESIGELLDRADRFLAAGGELTPWPSTTRRRHRPGRGDLSAASRAVLGLARGQRFDAGAGLLPARLHEVYVRADEPGDRARLAAALARTWAYASRPARAAPFADQAVEIARTLADPVLLADCLDAALAAHWGPDDLPRRRAWAAELDDTVAHLLDPRSRSRRTCGD